VAGGVFDELATFNCPLTQAQVTSNYPYPAILAQPAGQTVAAADTVLFSVAAGSPSGLSYQWQLGGANISGATNATFALTNVQPSARPAHHKRRWAQRWFPARELARLTTTTGGSCRRRSWPVRGLHYPSNL